MNLPDSQFTDLLTELIQVGNQLATAPDINALCRQAVEAGLDKLGFDRLSIWLVDLDRKLIRGTYGTDEARVIRDERGQSHAWADHMLDLKVVESPQTLVTRSSSPLFDDAQRVVGMGEVGAAALWNGVEVIGMLYTDNLVTQQPISNEQWRIFELYASTLGHLLSLKRTESALQSSEELLSQILDIMPVGVFVLSPEEKITRFNRAAQELWELEPAAIDAWSPTAFWAGDGRPVEKHEWAGRQALDHGQSVLHQEVEVLQADGTRQVILNSGVPLRDASGALTGAVVVNQDITDAKRREQQLEALEHMSQALRPLVGLRSVLHAIVTHLAQLLAARGVAVLLINQDRCVSVAAAMGDYLPLSGLVVPEEVTKIEGEAITRLAVHDAEGTFPLGAFQQLARTPRYMLVAPLEQENATVGSVVMGFDAAPDRAVMALVTALADVCAAGIQRGQLYDEVTTQAHRLDRVMESVNFGLVLLDSQRRVVLTNQYAKVKMAQLGITAAGEELHEVGGQRLGRFLTRPSSESHTQEIVVEAAIYEITTVPLGTTGADGGWLMVIHDVTRERAVQTGIQQHQRLAAVGQLAAGIAHDFNNIVAVISLYVQMIQRNPALPERDLNRLDVIREQAQNASKLIRQILDFSRQTLIERQRSDLILLIQESLALWKRTLPESIQFRFESSSLASACVLAEASSLQQALTNLAVNARDAMPQGGAVTVALRALTVGKADVPPVPGMKTGEWFQVTVTDSGEGIAPEHLPHIFDPFFTTKEIGKGTGLGLAQVYGIVQQHGGLVTARSEAGVGTSISLFLPAWHEGQSAAQEHELSDGAAEGSETVLLVEDNEPARDATAALLEMLGYRVIPASNGREALALFTEHREAIQLVLSDVIMPEMGGWELYQMVTAQNPNICMLMMTGYPLEQERQGASADATIEWLHKPFSVKQLTSAVRRVLARTKRADKDSFDVGA